MNTDKLIFGNALNPNLIPPFTTDRVLSPNKIAALIDCHPRTIRNWVLEHKLPCYRKGKMIRIRVSDVHKFLYQGLPVDARTVRGKQYSTPHSSSSVKSKTAPTPDKPAESGT